MKKYETYNPEIFYSDENKPEENAPRSSTKGKTASRNRVENRKKQERTSQSKKTNPSHNGVSLENLRASMTSRTTTVVFGIILMALCAFLVVSFVSYISSCVKDQSLISNTAVGSLPPVSNKGGEGGARISEFLINRGFGLGTFVLIIWVGAISLKLLVGRPKFKTLDFTVKCLIAFITLSLIVGLFTIASNTTINWGGYHGRYVNEWIIGFFGWWGAVILCLMMLALFVTICMRDVVKWVVKKQQVLAEKRREILEKRRKEQEKERALAEMREIEDNENNRESELNQNNESEGLQEEGSLHFAASENPEDNPEGYYSEIETANVTTSKSDEAESNDFVEKSGNEPASPVATSQTVNEEIEKSEKEPDEDNPMIVNINQIETVNVRQSGSRHSMYKFPGLDLLEDREEKINVNPEEQLDNKEKIRKTLLDFGFPITSIEATVGPTVTLYEIRPDKGHRIANIKRLVDDISLSLAAKGVRLIAPIPGKGTVGIEVANKDPQMVSMKTLLKSKKYQETKAELPLALGSTISNEVYIADLASIPHLLVAGATGQGKSVGLNVIISSLLYKKRPDELKFVLFDPKMVEFSLYAAIEKQYLAKLNDEEEAIVTDMNKVVPTLKSLCVEMDERYKLLKKAAVRKIDEYNKLVKKQELDSAEGHKFLPYIVVIIDEFSDLIMVAGKEVENPIARLAQKARAVGIHVIIATQRPSTTVITGNIKTNFPGRIAFKVSSSVDSKVILDASGAQQLIGKGDMLVLNNSETIRVQCAYIDTAEVKSICEHISLQPYPAENSPFILPEPGVLDSEGSESGSGMIVADKDPLYEEIRTYVINTGTASTSNLQRRYGIGYNRAGKIMDQLEAEGVVGPNQGGKPRAVLISL